MESKRTTAAVLCGVVVFVAVLNLVGWWIGSDMLKGWVPGTITMKITTALTFLAAAVLLFSLLSEIDGDVRVILAFFASSAILFLMGPFLFSLFTGRQTGFESLFIEDLQLIPMGKMPGWPSIGTVVAFLLIAALGFSYAFTSRKQSGSFLILGSAVAGIGALALIGHLLSAPVLYYNWGNFNAMAVNTAVLFVLCGACILLQKDEK